MSLLIGASSPAQGASGAQGAATDLGDTIGQSLRFFGDNKLSRNLQSGFGSFSSTATLSLWIKFDNQLSDSTQTHIWRGDNIGASGADRSLQITREGNIKVTATGNTSPTASTARLRDVAAWYHLMIIADSSEVKLYANGNLIFTNSSGWSAGTNSFNEEMKFECINEDGNSIEYYLAEVNFLDGTKATVGTDFGKLNSDGIWVPVAPSFTAAQYGTNGFRMQFNDSSNLGDDSAPIGASGHTVARDFTASGFNTTAISSSNIDNDISFDDTPNNNYCVLNTNLGRSRSLNFEKAALRAQYGAGGAHGANMSFGIPKNSGKWYWEVTLLEQKEGHLGVVSEDYDLEDDTLTFGQSAFGWAYFTGEAVRKNNNTETGSSHTIFSIDDTIGFLLDTTAGTLKIEINGVAQTSGNGSEFTNIPTDKRIYPFYYLGGASGDANLQWNFGQHAFQHEPTGYKHINTNNLPEPTIKEGDKQFGILEYTAAASFPITIDGSGGNNGTGNLDFEQAPDLVWIKMTNGSTEEVVIDSCRGAGQYLQPRNNGGKTDITNFAFATDGFTFSAGSEQLYQENDSYVAWCWKAGGAPTVTNDNDPGVAQDAGSVKVNGSNSSFAHGTIAVEKMSVNTTAGFSIVTYEGTGSAGTIPHGLGVKPEWAIFKRHDGTADWDCYHKEIGNTKIIKLNSTDGESAAGVAYYNNSGPDENTFSIGAGGANNSSGEKMVAYIWAPVEGFSKFGGYGGFDGGGSAPDMDGAYVETGFRPAYLLIKRYDGNGDNWILLDSKRDTVNFAFRAHKLGITDTPVSSGDQFAIDFLANGFKCRSNNAGINNASATYLYAAFASHPFGGENTPPLTAR